MKVMMDNFIANLPDYFEGCANNSIGSTFYSGSENREIDQKDPPVLSEGEVVPSKRFTQPSINLNLPCPTSG